MKVWKDVKGYEGYYKVSNLGNVKAIDRYVTNGNCKNFRKGRACTEYDNGKGYKTVCLSKNGKTKTITIHKLVAIAFLGHKPDGTTKICVDHINNIKTDNRLKNLQLISNRENASKDKKGYSSKYVGVNYHKESNKWRSCITINSRAKYLGIFKNEIDAHNAYQDALSVVMRSK